MRRGKVCRSKRSATLRATCRWRQPKVICAVSRSKRRTSACRCQSDADHPTDVCRPAHELSVFGHERTSRESLNQLIRELQQRLRDRYAKRLGGLEVDHQLELGRLLDRQIGWLRAFENFVHKGCCA